MSNTNSKSEVTDTWEINNRINIYLLDAIKEEHYSDKAAGKGRSVGEQLAHIHNIRIMWLKVAAPELLEGIEKLEKDNINKQTLAEQLIKSGEAISTLLEKGIAEGKIKGFKPHPAAFLGYLVAHEAHHRGQLILALKLSGHPVDMKTSYGLWEWGTR